MTVILVDFPFRLDLAGIDGVVTGDVSDEASTLMIGVLTNSCA